MEKKLLLFASVLYQQKNTSLNDTSWKACADPTAITGGTVITTGPYADTSIAVYQCLTGYIMSGTAFITCSSGTWSASPSCSQQDSNQVSVTLTENDDDDIPNWILYVIAGVCGLFALLIIACIIVVCCQMFGCYGKGALFGEHQPGNSVCCRYRRRRNSNYPQRHLCKTYPQQYEYDENGRRNHIDDVDRRCYYEHKQNHTTKDGNDADSETSELQNNSLGTSVTTVNEVMVEKNPQPPQTKELTAWKPHVHPVRSINTSTK